MSQSHSGFHLNHRRRRKRTGEFLPRLCPAFNALSGLGHLTGYLDVPLAELHDTIDCRVATTAAFAILSGLFHLVCTGEGQFIDLSSRESITMFTGEALMEFSMNGVWHGIRNGVWNEKYAHRRGEQSPGMATHGYYLCKGKDAWVTIAICQKHRVARVMQGFRPHRMGLGR